MSPPSTHAGDAAARIGFAELIIKFSSATAAAQATDDWSVLETHLREVFEAQHPPHVYVAALHVTYAVREHLPSWQPLRDFLLENSTEDIKKLLVGI